MTTENTSTPAPVMCGERTWKGAPCKSRAKYVLVNRHGQPGTPLCGRHLNSQGAGMLYESLDTTEK